MAKILITGGAGFIGLHLGRALANGGTRVDLLDNFSRAVRDADLSEMTARPEIRCVECDLRDAAAVAKLDTDYDVIFHFAAIVGVKHVLERPYQVLEQNNALLVNTIELARRQKALTRFVFTSTSEVYAGTLKSFGMQVPTPEATPLTTGPLHEARTSYMLSKIYGEALCHHSGLPITIVRPHNVYGPRMGLVHVVPELLKKGLALPDGGKLEVFSMSHKRTFCYVDDAVDLLQRIVREPRCTGRVLNLGSSGPEITIGELAQVVVSVLGKRLELVAMPETPGSPARRAPDMSLARELTGYVSSIDLRDGVARTYDWYQRNVFQGSGVSAT